METDLQKPNRFAWAWAPAVFGLLTFCMFADLLFTSSKVISNISTDLTMQFLNFRDFGFGQIAQGNFPLWNPHAYGGQPYFAGFQSALLYPPNWLHLFMSVPLAINWIVALHVFALGYFTYFWCRGRGVGIGGGILAGVMTMFSGPYFLHIYAGHLPHLAIIVWAPLMLLTLDKLAATGSIRWALFGIFVTSMQILAGHPQYVYYTGLTLSFYTVLLMIHSPHRWKLARGFVLMYVGAVLVTAVQLFAGLQAASEFVRSSGTTYEFASTFSLPPENLLTLLAPTFFSNLPIADLPSNIQYWGTGYLWELSLFMSVSGLIVAIIGAIYAPRRTLVILLAMAGFTILLALGRHTWLYRPLFNFLPGYSSFRGTVKFAYLFVIFASLLAGMGFDWLLIHRRLSASLVGVIAGGGVLILVLGAAISSSSENGPNGSWGGFIKEVASGFVPGEAFGPLAQFPQLKNEPEVIRLTGKNAANYTYLAGASVLLIAGILFASRFHRAVPYALIAMASVEMFVFAWSTRDTVDPAVARAVPPAWAESLAKIPKDERVLINRLEWWARGMSMGFNNLTGNDPGILRRYAELIFASVGLKPELAQQYLPFQMGTQMVLNKTVIPMLRCRMVYGYPTEDNDPNKPPMVLDTTPLPVAMLISTWSKGQHLDVLGAVVSGGFDPTKMVLVEEQPSISMMPGDDSPGTVQIVGETTDSLEFQIDLQRNAMLLVTNNYSSGWRILPIQSQQTDFEVLVANYAQIGVPLKAGKHHLILEYSPLAFRIGFWVSLISILALAGSTVWLMRKRA